MLRYLGAWSFRLIATVSGCTVIGIDDNGAGVDGETEAKVLNHGTHDVTVVHNHSATADVNMFKIDDETGLLTVEAVDDYDLPVNHRVIVRSGTDLVTTANDVFWAVFNEPDTSIAPNAPLSWVLDNQGQ